MTANEKARFSAREDIVSNANLSIGARLLYVLLDGAAGFKGEAWPKQDTLSKTMGCSKRRIRQWLQELGEWVEVIRQRRTAIYHLRWSHRERKQVATHTEQEWQQIATQSGNRLPLITSPSLYLNQESEQGSKIAHRCETCGDFGRVGGDLHGAICECSEGIAIRARLNRRRA